MKFVPKRDGATGGWENCIITSFCIFAVRKILLG